MGFKLFDWRRAAAMTFLAIPLSIRAEGFFRDMPRLQNTREQGQLPRLSIIVPARNEQENLPKLLKSLNNLRYPGEVEIIVVDDNSSDRTASIALDYGVKLIRLKSLTPGCLGKPNACHHGAREAQGEWLLFTDADTVHAPDGPAQSVSYAIQNHLDGLSLFLAQEFKSWFDRTTLMTAYAGLFASEDPERVILNGQYILLQNEAYWESGGFDNVCDQPLEDLALANKLRSMGYNVPMLLGYQAAGVQMYNHPKQVWHGLTRLGTGTVRWLGARSLLTALFITAVMSPLIVLVGVIRGKLDRLWLPATWAASSLSMIPWAGRFGSRHWALISPIGAFIVLLASVWGLIIRLFGGKQTWKGRKV